ncbi:FliM/FliN family flagellar motor C-terminal domain-containing protein [Edaphobacter albus]|uniref:FliM/FliN family flagellar motor C-terminal domain-containing protein n=1 Tax=Edaphobacter sp. 4G125 TaxID=2763071 RepID=UPI001646F3FE|nr:FliM/FliN family flagellar motor C-terminal domain-containing protein [Edaphobacter sp. 4G125]QNI35274.1 FliM/FliN family flagellar motor switch protein [Edaphobacter sp. 4G125]
MQTELVKTDAVGLESQPLPENDTQKGDVSRIPLERMEEHPLWALLSRMTVVAMAGIPLSEFKIGDLLRLKPGELIESDWQHTEDVPVRAGRVQVAWSEFEVADQRLMVRLTRLT